MDRTRIAEAGFSLTEVLVIASLFTVLGLSFVSSNAMMADARGRISHNSAASQLAIEALESYAGIDPVTLTAQSATANVVRNGVTFSRAVTISVNADGSRTIAVAVTCPNCRLGGSASLSSNVPQWGSA